ncbi:hypothetical protein Hanom_Chr01g00045161 [Helianthus anomalus]
MDDYPYYSLSQMKFAKPATQQGYASDGATLPYFVTPGDTRQKPGNLPRLTGGSKIGYI